VTILLAGLERSSRSFRLKRIFVAAWLPLCGCASRRKAILKSRPVRKQLKQGDMALNLAEWPLD
jgi:hypothetical protein